MPRLEAVEILGLCNLASADSAEFLLGAANGDSAAMQETVVASLARLAPKDAACLAALKQIAREGRSYTRAAATEELKRLGK